MHTPNIRAWTPEAKEILDRPEATTTPPGPPPVPKPPPMPLPSENPTQPLPEASTSNPNPSPIDSTGYTSDWMSFYNPDGTRKPTGESIYGSVTFRANKPTPPVKTIWERIIDALHRWLNEKG